MKMRKTLHAFLQFLMLLFVHGDDARSQNSHKLISNPSQYVLQELQQMDPESRMNFVGIDGDKVKKKVKDVLSRVTTSGNPLPHLTKNKDGTLQHLTSAELSMSELTKSEENKDLHKFVQMGQYAHALLKKHGYINGEMTNLRSGNLISGTSSSKLFQDRSFIITVKSGDGKESEYEVVLDIDDKKYKAPYAAITEAFHLKEDRAIKLDIPSPLVPGSTFDKKAGIAITIFILIFITEVLIRSFGMKCNGESR